MKSEQRLLYNFVIQLCISKIYLYDPLPEHFSFQSISLYFIFMITDNNHVFLKFMLLTNVERFGSKNAWNNEL